MTAFSDFLGLILSGECTFRFEDDDGEKAEEDNSKDEL